MQLSIANREGFIVEGDKQNAGCFYSSLSPVASLGGGGGGGAACPGCHHFGVTPFYAAKP